MHKFSSQYTSTNFITFLHLASGELRSIKSDSLMINFFFNKFNFAPLLSLVQCKNIGFSLHFLNIFHFLWSKRSSENLTCGTLFTWKLSCCDANLNIPVSLICLVIHYLFSFLMYKNCELELLPLRTDKHKWVPLSYASFLQHSIHWHSQVIHRVSALFNYSRMNAQTDFFHCNLQSSPAACTEGDLHRFLPTFYQKQD